MSDSRNVILSLIDRHYQRLLADWLACQKRDTRIGDTQREAETAELARRFLEELRRCASTGQSYDTQSIEWAGMRALLDDLSRSRVAQGFSPSETATFVLSLKEPLFELLRSEIGGNADDLARETWTTTRLLDQLGLYTVEGYVKTREEVIARQQQELLELSTPVVELWEGVLALPLIGTLDSSRTQIVMESLLERIVVIRRGDRNHRHHRRADRRYTGRAASDQDDIRGPIDGGGLHPQRHPAADRADDRASWPGAERGFEGHDGGCAGAGAAQVRQDGGRSPEGPSGDHTGNLAWLKSPS